MATSRIGVTRRAVLHGLAGVSLAPAVAFAADASADVPKRGGSMTFMLNYEPPVLLSLTNVMTGTLSVSAKVTEGLLEYDFDMNPRPQLATAWSVSDDGLTYSFQLRRGVKWHDGKDFTSADVAYSLMLIKKVHPRGRSTFANLLEVQTPDDHTAILKLAKPAPYMAKAFAAPETPMVPKHIYENTDPNANPNSHAPIGTGPFVFKEWVKGSHVLYTRNPDYWAPGLPYLDQLVITFVADPAARAAALETGAADIGYRNPLPLADMDRMKSVPSLHFESHGASYTNNVTYIEFNLDNPLFKDPRVRQAVSHAINRDIVIRTVYYGYALPCNGAIPPELKDFADLSPAAYPYDVAAAAKLLDDAGYKVKSDGTRFQLTMDYNPITEDTVRLAEYTRAALSRIGVHVDLRAQDLGSYIKRIYTDRDFAFHASGVSCLFDPTVGIQRIYDSKAFVRGVPNANASHYDNPDVDKLLYDAAVENNLQTRIGMFKSFQQIVARELPVLNLASPQYVTIHNIRAQGHSVTADGPDGNFSRAYIKS